MIYNWEVTGICSPIFVPSGKKPLPEWNFWYSRGSHVGEGFKYCFALGETKACIKTAASNCHVWASAPSRCTGLWAGVSLCLLWKWAFRLSQYPFHQWSQSRALNCRTLETLHECMKGLGATLLCTGAGKLSSCPALSINMEDDGEAQGRPADQGMTSSCQQLPGPGRRPRVQVGPHFFLSLIQQLLPYLGRLDLLGVRGISTGNVVALFTSEVALFIKSYRSRINLCDPLGRKMFSSSGFLDTLSLTFAPTFHLLFSDFSLGSSRLCLSL